ncbi:MAG: hypothetical protein HZB19_21195 [Chloroflexi bacterium]|nr:hypothetical protein [Chloroflexota bacterium]
MKKFGFISIIALLISACSLPGISTAPTQPASQPTPVKIGTATQPATLTGTQPTPTFTSTPTVLGGLPPTARKTSTKHVTVTPTFTPLPIFPDTPTPLILVVTDTPGEGFRSVEISGNKIFWGICKPGTVNLTAEVTEPDEVVRVYLFIHLLDFDTPDTTPWYGTVMDGHEDGTFTYMLNADYVDGRRNYLKAWVVYQMVAVDKDEKTIGRTKIYEQTLTIEPCK